MSSHARDKGNSSSGSFSWLSCFSWKKIYNTLTKMARVTSKQESENSEYVVAECNNAAQSIPRSKLTAVGVEMEWSAIATEVTGW
jgi:hypothetical protein